MYKLTKTDSVIRLADGACIPKDDGNVDWREYLAWRSAGNIPFASETLDEAKARRIGEIKAEAGARIEARYPAHKQRNMLARLNELHDKRLDGITLTAGEKAEVTNMRAAWDLVKQVRQASNDAEAQVSAAATISAVDAVIPAWPA